MTVACKLRICLQRQIWDPGFEVIWGMKMLASCVMLGKILNLSEPCQMGVGSFVDSEELKKSL